MEFEAVIGLETHVQLNTASKIFCGSSAAFGAEPNSYIDPVTLGLPGALPVLNKRAVEFAVMLGLALNCEIRKFNRFARKHYFYPDLPKGYQISQYDEPICERGNLEIQVDDSERTVGIKRVHLEEDAGKNIHDARKGCSLIDLNRAGVALLEVVSEPDIRSAQEAAAYLRTLRQIVRFLKISDGNMEEGSLRCDANISLRRRGELKFGVRTEIKNINSFKFVERALEYEMARQLALLRAGKEVVQETLHFDSASGTTSALRSKEESAEYRYFPDPDLPPVVVEDSWIAEIRAKMPKLPREVKRELIQALGLSAYDAEVLCAENHYVEYFYATLQVCSNARLVCNWITSELFGYLNKKGLELSVSPVSPQNLGMLLKLLDSDTISGKMAKIVFEEMFETGKSAGDIVEARGLKQITDDNEILKLVQSVFEKNRDQLAKYVGGNDKLHGFFVGQVLKASGGSANPQKVNDIISEQVKALRSQGV